jgi:hypothetical protein
MKNKNRILKNYLNHTTFNQGLLSQQNNLIQFYNSINNKNSNIINDLTNFSSINKKNENTEIKKEELILECDNIYNIRLNETKEGLIKLSKNKWPNIEICKNILELKGNVKQKINIIL